MEQDHQKSYFNEVPSLLNVVGVHFSCQNVEIKLLVMQLIIQPKYELCQKCYTLGQSEDCRQNVHPLFKIKLYF